MAWTWIPLAVIASLLSACEANREGNPYWPTNPSCRRSWPGNAGAVAGFVAAATLACLFLAVEIVPRLVWSLTLGALGVDVTLFWIVFAIAGWAAAGVVVGFILAVAIPVRVIVYPPIQGMLAEVFAMIGSKQRFASDSDAANRKDR